MIRLLIALVLCFSLTGCEGEFNQSIFAQPVKPVKPVKPVVNKEWPIVNVPMALRQENWVGDQREGSCVHATMISLLRWQGRYNKANKWRQTYANGEWPAGLASKFDREGVRYAYTDKGDVAFLEWACRTRRGCGITIMGGAHMVALVHLDADWACLLDNNNVSKYKWVPRRTLIAEWKASHGWAVVPIYTPAAPLPQ
jgi:hypothetical protein